MASKPIEADEDTWKLILDALCAKEYEIHTGSERYLAMMGFKPVSYIVEDLINYLKEYHLFELPKQNPTDRQKYQLVLSYEKKLLIHVKITPWNSDPPEVALAFHSHNTGYKPLPEKRHDRTYTT